MPHKRVEIALRAVAQLADELPDLECVVAGQGWWRPQLQALAAELDIDKRVRFSGYVSEAEKHAILSWAWVALLPSLKEGWGLTIVEAGARGTPTVAFRAAGGVAEAIVDGETGLLADGTSDSPPTWATCSPSRRHCARWARRPGCTRPDSPGRRPANGSRPW